jgi:uncharacterized protein (TIGR02466 family)
MPDIIIENIVVDHTEIFYIKNVLTLEESTRLTSQILKYKNSHIPSPSETKMQLDGNIDCWRGEPWQNDGFSKEDNELILEKIQKSFEYFVENLPTEQTYKSKILSSDRTIYIWANVNGPGSDNLIHKHSKAFMSGVLYCQSTGTGPIEFISSIWLDSTTRQPWPWAKTHKISAEDGDMVVFPGYLFHQVKTNLSTNSRINLAFNVYLNT